MSPSSLGASRSVSSRNICRGTNPPWRADRAGAKPRELIKKILAAGAPAQVSIARDEPEEERPGMWLCPGPTAPQARAQPGASPSHSPTSIRPSVPLSIPLLRSRFLFPPLALSAAVAPARSRVLLVRSFWSSSPSGLGNSQLEGVICLPIPAAIPPPGSGYWGTSTQKGRGHSGAEQGGGTAYTGVGAAGPRPAPHPN